jgi:Cytotoxic
MSYIPPPKILPAFPDAQSVKPKTLIQGGGGLRKRWKDPEGIIYEWDSRHGTVEIYDRKGRHLGEYDAESGECLRPPNSSYSVEP